MRNFLDFGPESRRRTLGLGLFIFFSLHPLPIHQDAPCWLVCLSYSNCHIRYMDRVRQIRQRSALNHTLATTGSQESVRRNRRIQRALTKLYAITKGWLVRKNPYDYMDDAAAEYI